MEETPDGSGLLIVGVILLLMLVTYVVPSIVALVRRHHRRPVILAVNMLLGWTGIGWVVALVLALRDPRRAP